jgi:hypothetical protein
MRLPKTVCAYIFYFHYSGHISISCSFIETPRNINCLILISSTFNSCVCFPAIRSKRHLGGLGLGGSRAQAAAYNFGGGYGNVGYPGGFGGPAFGSPVGSAFGSPGGGGGFGGLGGLGGGFSGSTAQSSSSAFGTNGGFWG